MSRVLVIGDCCFDNVYLTEHITSANEHTLASSYQQYLGGDGLIMSVAAARVGGNVSYAGFIGSDGSEFLYTLQENGVNTAYTKTVREKCGHSLHQITSDGTSCTLTLLGAGAVLDKAYINEVLQYFTKNDILLLGGKTSLTDYIITSAHARGMQIIFAPATSEDINFSPLDKVTYLALNDSAISISRLSSDAELAAFYLRRSHPQLKILLITDSNGAYLFDESKQIYQPPYELCVKDTGAAASVLAGYFASGIAQGTEPVSAFKLAVAAAALSSSKIGALPSVPRAIEVEAVIRNVPFCRQEIRKEDRVTEIDDYIDSHILTANLDELSEHLGYSRIYTCSLIKKLTGKSFSDILKEKRCRLCAKLLRETDLSVKEIIDSVGYENETFFRRIFKELYGTTPLKYRKEKTS